MIKLESKYIKSKLKDKFGELEVYNSQLVEGVHIQLNQMIKDNSKPINLENGMSDIQINNTIKTMRFMLINLTNIEDSNYWNSISDEELENILNLADGDFKQVAHSLLDIMLEIAQDIRLEERRKLDIVKDKITELTDILRFSNDVESKLKEFGLDKELLVKIQNGDKEAIEQFQKSLVKNVNKPKRQYTKKSKK